METAALIAIVSAISAGLSHLLSYYRWKRKDDRNLSTFVDDRVKAAFHRLENELAQNQLVIAGHEQRIRTLEIERLDMISYIFELGGQWPREDQQETILQS